MCVGRIRRNEAQRLEYFKNEPLCGALTKDSAECKRCGKSVRLGGRTTYRIRPWEMHRVKCDQMPAPVDDDPDDDAQKSKQRAKTVEQRIAILTADSAISSLKPHEVLCRNCGTWVRLSSNVPYKITNWKAHTLTCQHQPSDRVAAATRKLRLVNDSQVKSFTECEVVCVYCGSTVISNNENGEGKYQGEYSLLAWTEHKVTCTHYETQDGLYDLAWSEIHENQLVTASGDGSIKLWDVMLNDLPIRAWQEHTREVYSVDWSNIKKDTFASSCWDGTVKLWTPDRPRSLSTLQAHQSCVYQALFSPHQPDTLATCSTDGTVKIFDLRSPAYVPSGPGNNFTTPMSAAVLTIPASPGEVLSIDWNKYRPLTLASAGVDKVVNIWDCRMIKPGELNQVGAARETQLFGHEYPVRQVQWSPHRADILATASYDMTCRVWNTAPAPGRAQLMHIHDSHTEFVVGCGWSLYEEGIVASCGWDSRLNIFRV
ncbi:Peroxisomal targeting signal 2 receptor [Termitomyces sp. J132]|nr:Peroxisomal targeting signal 2 receptor [Termitomyces sp. J132]